MGATVTYRATGNIRGWCGHEHKTVQTAYACVGRDQSRCKQVGGYSDRVVRRADGEDLTEAEKASIEDLYMAEQVR